MTYLTCSAQSHIQHHLDHLKSPDAAYAVAVAGSAVVVVNLSIGLVKFVYLIHWRSYQLHLYCGATLRAAAVRQCNHYHTFAVAFACQIMNFWAQLAFTSTPACVSVALYVEHHAPFCVMTGTRHHGYSRGRLGLREAGWLLQEAGSFQDLRGYQLRNRRLKSRTEFMNLTAGKHRPNSNNPSWRQFSPAKILISALFQSIQSKG